MAKFVHGRTMLSEKKTLGECVSWDWIVFDKQGEPLDHSDGNFINVN